MANDLDPAVAAVLPDDSTNVSVSPIGGGSGFANALKIHFKSGGSEKSYFLKTSSDVDAEIMFKGEHASLNAIQGAVPSLCPRSIAADRLASTSGAFLLTEYIDFSANGPLSQGVKRQAGERAEGSGMTLAAKLAKLHSIPAPILDGHTAPVFGFPIPTCCGNSIQDNGYSESWATFYAENRLKGILRIAERKNGVDKNLRSWVEKTASEIVPKLLGDGHLGGKNGITPVVIHGDLWSGNKSRGRVGDNEAPEDVVFDPSSCYGHSEYEHGIMQMFGGFSQKTFWEEYWKLVPKTEPVKEYEDRLELYTLYHQLNHYAIFGGGYKSGAIAIMKALSKKYC